MNYASRYAKEVDERFTRASQAVLALNNDYKFTGVQTVNVYSIPTVPMVDYNREGAVPGLSRYGVPENLAPSVQELKVEKDRSFTFTIDKGDKLQSEMVLDAGRALSRQTLEVWVPEYDTYVFNKLASVATARGNTDNTALTKANAYQYFLKGMEALGNKNVPDQGRVCFGTYGFVNLLKQDPAFMRYGDSSQAMLVKGVIGEVDGCKIVKVPASRLPAGAAFIITHPIAATAPKQLEDFRIHDDPPGISGWLVEGRVIYDCFVLDSKADAVYYHGAQPVLQTINAYTSPGKTSGKTVFHTEPSGLTSGNAYYYHMVTDPANFYGAVSGTAITYANWTLVKDASNNPIQIDGFSAAASANTNVEIVEVNATDYKPVAYGTTIINKA